MMKSVLGMAAKNSGEIKETQELEEVDMQDGSCTWLWNSPRMGWKGEF